MDRVRPGGQHDGYSCEGTGRWPFAEQHDADFATAGASVIPKRPPKDVIPATHTTLPTIVSAGQLTRPGPVEPR